jgi:hypothetical protein
MASQFSEVTTIATADKQKFWSFRIEQNIKSRIKRYLPLLHENIAIASKFS